MLDFLFRLMLYAFRIQHILASATKTPFSRELDYIAYFLAVQSLIFFFQSAATAETSGAANDVPCDFYIYYLAMPNIYLFGCSNI